MAGEGTAIGAAGPSAPAASPGDLPDINAQTYPFEEVQRALDRAALFHLHSTPEEGEEVAERAPGGATVGFRVHESLHRCPLLVETPAAGGGPVARRRVGERMARFRHRWMLLPDDHAALPGREPPATPFQPDRSQRFALLDGECVFEGGDRFRGFGTGLTVPRSGGGVHAAAVGTILEGTGPFRDVQGTYTYCGTLHPDRGFEGNMVCRVIDPAGALRARGGLPPCGPPPAPEPGVSYLAFRGQKRGAQQKTAYSFGADGRVDGLDVHQDLRWVHLDCAAGATGPRSLLEVGPLVGSMTAKIRFRLFDPGAPGTDLSPIPFQSYNEYTFVDRDGRTVGTVVADGGEGRTFQLALPGLPGQRALRFGGFGPVVRGSGAFDGIRGLMSDNSAVGVAPHALATFYVLRVEDPDGRYRRAFEGILG